MEFDIKTDVDPYDTYIRNVKLVRDFDLYDEKHSFKKGYVLIHSAETKNSKKLAILTIYAPPKMTIVVSKTDYEIADKESKDIGYNGLLIYFIKDLILAPLYT